MLLVHISYQFVDRLYIYEMIVVAGFCDRRLRTLNRWQALDLPDRPDFNRSDTRCGNPARDVDRFVEILGVDQEIAADLLASLREGTVGHEPFTVANAYTDRLRGWIQRRSVKI